MKKRFGALWKTASVLLMIGGIEMLIMGAMYQGSPDKVEPITSIQVEDISDTVIVYVEELEVLKRYAFETVSEYEDIESGYTDTTYYAYEDAHHMDVNELYKEHYIVKFRDQSGEDRIAAMSISVNEEIASSLSNAPIKLSVCLRASPESEGIPSDDHYRELKYIREKALDEYAETHQIPRSCIRFSYVSETIEEYEEEFETDLMTFRILSGIGGVLCAIFSVMLWRYVNRKRRNAETVDSPTEPSIDE